LLGHSRLCELLKDDRFQDICHLRLQGSGYVVEPASMGYEHRDAPGPVLLLSKILGGGGDKSALGGDVSDLASESTAADEHDSLTPASLSVVPSPTHSVGRGSRSSSRSRSRSPLGHCPSIGSSTPGLKSASGPEACETIDGILMPLLVGEACFRPTVKHTFVHLSPRGDSSGGCGRRVRSEPPHVGRPQDSLEVAVHSLLYLTKAMDSPESSMSLAAPEASRNGGEAASPIARKPRWSDDVIDDDIGVWWPRQD